MKKEILLKMNEKSFRTLYFHYIISLSNRFCIHYMQSYNTFNTKAHCDFQYLMNV